MKSVTRSLEPHVIKEPLPELVQGFIDQVIDLFSAYRVLNDFGDHNKPGSSLGRCYKVVRNSDGSVKCLIDKHGFRVTLDTVMEDKAKIQRRFGVRIGWSEWDRIEERAKTRDWGEWMIELSDTVRMTGEGKWWRDTYALPMFWNVRVWDDCDYSCQKYWWVTSDTAGFAFGWLFTKNECAYSNMVGTVKLGELRD